MKTLFVSWRDATSREWIPVARLDWDGKFYRFSYTKGAKRARSFEPFGKMSDLNGVYRSETLFALFLNRLISKSRPEYSDYLSWMGLRGAEDDAMAELGISGGLRGADSIELVPMPSLPCLRSSQRVRTSPSCSTGRGPSSSQRP